MTESYSPCSLLSASPAIQVFAKENITNKEHYREGKVILSGVCLVSLTDHQNQVIVRERSLHLMPHSCFNESYLCFSALKQLNVFFFNSPEL